MAIKQEQVLIDIHHKYLLGKFTGDIFHEVNNIVGASIGFAQLAQISMKEDDVKKMIDIVLRSAGRIKGISRSAQTYLSDQTLENGIIDISILVTDCINLVKKSFNKKGAQITFDNKGLVSFNSNTAVLRHVILSLISFLFENLENGGTINITAGKINSTKIKLIINYDKVAVEPIQKVMNIPDDTNLFLELHKVDNINNYYDGLVAVYLLRKELKGTVESQAKSIIIQLEEINP